MKKSFKKAIAAMLAVLMVVCALPMTAFAAPGDYTPNVNLRFSTVSDVTTTKKLAGEGAYVATATDKSAALKKSGLFGVPLDYSAKNGTLTLKASKAAAFASRNKLTAPTEDYSYTTGDFFAVTILVENISKINALSAAIGYSENVEPACAYQYWTENDEEMYKFATVTEYNEDVANDMFDSDSPDTMPGKYVVSQSCQQFHSPMNAVANASKIDYTDRYILENDASTAASIAVGDIEAAKRTYFYSPVDGSEGYVFPSTYISATYLFKITGPVDAAHPIQFTAFDTDNHYWKNFEGGMFIADSADTTMVNCLTTAAPNVANGVVAPGSEKMTYNFTTADGNDPTPGCDHANQTTTEEITKAATCIATGLKTVTVTCDDCNEVISVTENVEVAIDPANHAGNKTVSDPVVTPATCVATGKSVVTTTCDDCGKVIDTKETVLDIDSTNHKNVSSVVTAPTCTEKGYTTWTCADCQASWTTDETPATGHVEYSAWAHVEGTEKADAQHARTCLKGDDTQTAACDFEYKITTPATVTSAGEGKYTCKVCGYSYTEEIPVQTCNHANTTDVETSRTAATCVAKGEVKYNVVCNDCGKTVDTKTVPLDVDPANHADAPTATRDVNVKDATCGADGSKDVETYCTACGVTLSTEENVTIPATGDHKNIETTETVTKAATCVATGEKTVTETCKDCGTVVKTTEGVEVAIDPANHADAATATRDVNVKDATCGADGSKDVETYCTACGVTLSTEENVTIPATGKHTPGTPVEKIVEEATVDHAGKKEIITSCTTCGAVLETVEEEIAIIPSYTVTVDPATLGTVTINGADATNGAAVKVAKNPVSKVTLTATPAANAEFVGWTIDGKSLISTDATYVATVLANVTYTPVFALADTEFTVTFVDAYGNVIDTQKVASAAAITMPEAPNRAGYTFVGWSMTADEIAAIDGATTIAAVYEKNAADLFTVTATGCTITVDGAEVADVATDVAYDTLVTVTADGATAWKIGDVIVAYGDTYTFYVGSDVEVTPVTDATVKAEPTVANVSKTEVVEANGMKRCTFLATRSMEGFTCVNYGFVYANTENTAITLDDVNGSSVKAFYCKTGVDQFSLTYGLKAQAGTVTARAFVAYIDANGDTKVKYADAQTYTYAE